MSLLKKITSLFLALILLFVSQSPAFALQSCNCGNHPLIVISGMANFPLYLDDGNGNETLVFPPVLDADLLKPLVRSSLVSLAKQDWQALSDLVISSAYDVFEPIAFKPDGTPASDVTTPKFPLSMDHYPEMTFKDLDYGGRTLLDSASDRYGADHVFFFNYDWRYSPLDNADDLNVFINTVKQTTGHSKVNLAACSLGGAQTMAYFYKYGGNDVNSCVFICAAFTGNLLDSDLLAREFMLNTESLITMAKFMITQGKNAFLAPALDLLFELGKLDKIFSFLGVTLDFLLNRLYDEVLTDIAVTMPGLWSFVQAEQYEYAKSIMLDQERNAALIEKIDDFQYNVHQRAKEILDDTIADGTKMAFTAHYNIYSIPIYASANEQNDGLVETTCSSGGAVCAPVGATLPEGYVQANYCDGRNHLSADHIIDASTSMFPDYTWFFKSIRHVGASYNSEYNEFIFWLLEQETQPDVWQNPDYPQFMSSDDNGKTLTSLADNPQFEDYSKNIFMISRRLWLAFVKAREMLDLIKLMSQTA